LGLPFNDWSDALIARFFFGISADLEPTMTEAWERFYLATLTLVGPGPIKQRLIGAFLDNLGDLSPDQLPKIIQNDFIELTNILKQVTPIGKETRVHATVRKMSDAEADLCAGKIVQIYSTVTRQRAIA
jgi:hypothetical protein